ncbi:MAG: dTMP kinase [bacterium]
MNSPGKLIVFEGIDGCGKTTQQLNTVTWLQTQGLQVLALREPTDGPKGQQLRISAEEGRLSPEDELALFLADRKWNIDNNILPAIKQGRYVLLDRFNFSTIAYQGARGLDPEELQKRNEAFAPIPDLVLLFDLDPELAIERIKTKRGETPNLFEKIDYLTKVREIFLSINTPYIKRIDATPAIADVWRQVETELRKLV